MVSAVVIAAFLLLVVFLVFNVPPELFNLILAMVCGFGSLILVLETARQDRRNFSVMMLRTLAIGLGVSCVLFWVLLDMLGLPNMIVNDSTLVVLSLFILFAIATATSAALNLRLELLARRHKFRRMQMR